ncbi:CD177 antigen [Tamandua tetradactyla]|uniref:CD177 antigen n=1 Tax=Tamandua tetradactyla TaxID=48850 RepID=UPI0040549490
MLSAWPLLLLGAALSLPGSQALVCQEKSLSFMGDVQSLPLQWTNGVETCKPGWGCQDTVLLIENGAQVHVVLSKGCSQAKDHEARLTRHRAGPGLSIVSYSRVCRRENLCNDLNTTQPVWKGPSSPVIPGPVRGRCPVCLSTDDCPKDGPELPCPGGPTHCYDGVLLFRGEDISTNQRVRGCIYQAGCNLLNGTRQLGPISVSESCNLKDFPVCHRGVTLTLRSNLSQEPTEWDVNGKQMCDIGELCQETLLLIDTGHQSTLLGSKGCISAQVRYTRTVSIHSRRPGVLVASYAHVCSSSWCNNANSSSVLLKALPPSEAPAPGAKQCPVCVNLGSSCLFSRVITCPKGTTHCYSGTIRTWGGNLQTTVGVQGCLTKSSSTLLNHTQDIGVFSVTENVEPENPKEEPLLQDGVAPAPCLAWVVGLGLSLALCFGGALSSLLIPFPHGSYTLLISQTQPSF